MDRVVGVPRKVGSQSGTSIGKATVVERTSAASASPAVKPAIASGRPKVNALRCTLFSQVIETQLVGAAGLRRQAHARITGSGRGNRLIARDRHPVTRAQLGVIIPDRLVQAAAIVPEGDGMRLPAKPALESLLFAMGKEEIQDCPALAR